MFHLLAWREFNPQKSLAKQRDATARFVRLTIQTCPIRNEEAAERKKKEKRKKKILKKTGTVIKLSTDNLGIVKIKKTLH